MRRLVGLFAIAALVSGLMACARDPYVTTTRTVGAGLWKIERQPDRITGAPLSSALLTTRESANSEDYFTKPATLQLMCLKQQPVVRIGFQFRVGSTRNASLGYRFDDRPGHEAAARFIQDFRTVVIEDQAEVARFARELATSKVLYIRIRSLNYPRSSAEFEVEGGDAAMQSAFASCPIQGGPLAAATLQ